MKRFTITGKKVFRDNQEGIYYVELNSGMRITVENNPETMAMIAWSQSSPEHRKQFVLNQFNTTESECWFEDNWSELPKYVKEALIAYQKSKMEIKA